MLGDRGRASAHWLRRRLWQRRLGGEQRGAASSHWDAAAYKPARLQSGGWQGRCGRTPTTPRHRGLQRQRWRRGLRWHQRQWPVDARRAHRSPRQNAPGSSGSPTWTVARATRTYAARCQQRSPRHAGAAASRRGPARCLGPRPVQREGGTLTRRQRRRRGAWHRDPSVCSSRRDRRRRRGPRRQGIGVQRASSACWQRRPASDFVQTGDG